MDSKSSSKSGILPFFPNYETDLICQDKLRITWFEEDFSQSRYNFEKRPSGSNACTIITIIFAANCSRDSIEMNGPFEEVSDSVIRTLGQAMLEGNNRHRSLKHQGILPNMNLTVPEAIKFAGRRASGIKEWKSFIYMQNLGLTLHMNLMKHYEEWKQTIKNKKLLDLYVVIICGSRSVLFVFNHELETVTLIDTHQHSPSKGVCIAEVELKNIRCLCAWLNHIMLKYCQSVPHLYELSYLYFKKK